MIIWIVRSDAQEFLASVLSVQNGRKVLLTFAKSKKKTPCFQGVIYISAPCYFPTGKTRSIVTAAGLNFGVRYGNQCFPSAMGTDDAPLARISVSICTDVLLSERQLWPNYRWPPIASQCTFLVFSRKRHKANHKKSMPLLVHLGWTRYRAYTWCLSTW